MVCFLIMILEILYVNGVAGAPAGFKGLIGTELKINESMNKYNEMKRFPHKTLDSQLCT